MQDIIVQGAKTFSHRFGKTFVSLHLVMSRPIVTLTTDWGDAGFFAGMVKGLLYSHIEDVQVVDITHSMEAYNVMTATFVVRQACMGFPAGTIHIIDVATRQPYLCVKARGQYFLCCDNGLPSMAFGNDIEDARLLQINNNSILNFAAYSLFARVAVLLARGASMNDLGEPAQLAPRTMQNYIMQGDNYRIYVHYIDHYGNAYLGMSYKEFEEIRQGRSFVLSLRDLEVTELTIGYYSQHTSTDPRHRLHLTVSATGMLELAIKEGSLAQLVGLRVSESVLLRFK
jgi:hypothetical protein